MPIPIDHQLREQITHVASVFPITYFPDELATLPNRAGPLHWHPEFEIATAVSGILDFQVGQKHITLPFIIFRHENSWHDEVNRLVEDIYCQLRERNVCYELVVQRDLNSIFEYLFRHFDDLPKSEATRIQINTQIRIQQMLTYIYTHYAESVTLDDIARAADISRQFRRTYGYAPGQNRTLGR